MLPRKGVIRKRIFEVILRSRFIFERWNQDLIYFLRRKCLSNVRILVFFMRWWFRTRRLLSFFVKFCLILFFHFWSIACINWALWKYTSLLRWYASFNVCHFLNWQDSFTNWSTKLIFYCESLVKVTIELSIIIRLLNHRFCERMAEMVSGSVDRYCFQFSKIFL